MQKPSRAPGLLRRELPAAQLLLARGVVLAFAAFVAVFFARWTARWIDVREGQAEAFSDPGSTELVHVAASASIMLALIAILIWWLLAGLVFYRRSRDWFGLYLSVAFFCFGGCLTDPSRFMPLARADTWPMEAAVLLFANTFTLPWVFVFPDGRPIPRWAGLLVAWWVGWYLVRMVTPAADPHGLWDLVWIVVPLWAVASVVYRYARVADEVQRSQIKWIALAGTFYVVPWAILNLAPDFLPGITLGRTGFYYTTAAASLYALAQVVLPLAIATAIFRQGLLDIDLLINRAVVYAALTGILVGGFVLISWSADLAVTKLTGRSSAAIPLLAAATLAIAFAPFRKALVRLADRFMSGRRVLTVVFLDIVRSTEHAIRLGDRSWRELLERFQSTVRREIRRFGGEEVDTAGDGFFITFAGAEQAVNCMCDTVRAVRPLGIEVRAAVHIGEVEVHGDKVSGVAVHIAARLVGLAEPSQVVVSAALRELIRGSNIDLADRGEHELRGVPGAARVYAVT